MAIELSKAELARQKKIMRERIKIDEESGKKPSRPVIGNHTPGKAQPKSGKK